MLAEVYWLKNESCKDKTVDGYIGVSQNAKHRFSQHKKRSFHIPADAVLDIIFTGERSECFELERKLRPLKGIGWNKAPGGVHGYKLGFKHSDSSIQKMQNSWTSERRENAGIIRTQENKKSIGKKKPKQSLAMLGNKNPMFGKLRTEKEKKKISESNRGKIPPNKQELYCIGCKQRSSMHVLSRHSKCWKNYKNENM